MAAFVGETYTFALNIQVDSVDTDPSALTFELLSPQGNRVRYVYATDAELIKDSAGDYHVDYVLDEPGTWHWRWEGTGTAPGVEEGSVQVKRERF